MARPQAGAATIFDLPAYLARIALKPPPAADAAGLALVQRAHRLAIPFENLDVALGRPIRIDGESVFAKLVAARRGGYCFEHNQLFGDALAALGFAVRPLLARVRLGLAADAPSPAATHCLSLVAVAGVPWIADAGFGGSYAPPMPLADGAEAVAPDGARFRLRADPAEGWRLSRLGDPATTDGRATGEGWQDQYVFTDAPVAGDALAAANAWVQSAPESRFVQRRIVSVPLPQGFASLDGTRYRRRNGEQQAEADLLDPRVYRLRLALLFGLQLSAEEVGRLGLFP